ncbi:MAG: hypothetical protein IT429_25710, partial [Gemmataceae bacterium]|nr:hypothetical protein [Gemmataceae bacterium]
EPPRKRTGWLQRHVQYRLDREQSRGVVGVAAQAPYGLALELGTKNMAARPFLLSTLEKYREQLQAIARG